MKLRSFISRLQKLNAYLEEFSPYTDGQETEAPPADEIMDIIYHSMPTTWRIKMIEQCFNYADSTVKETTAFFETREKNWNLKMKRKKFSSCQEMQGQGAQAIQEVLHT